MSTKSMFAGLALAALAAAMAVAGNVEAQPRTKLDAKAAAKVRMCQDQCASDPICRLSCGATVTEPKIVEPPRTEPEPPVVKSWQDDVFGRSKDNAGGGGSGGGR